MPLTWGGKIRTTEDMYRRFEKGADKITINTEAYKSPSLIEKGAKAFGSQAIVISIDAKLADGKKQWKVAINCGREITCTDVVEWSRRVENMGAGEILLQSIDRDGSGTGYDLELINAVATAVKIPVIACSGVGSFEHYAEAIKAGASAAAAANIWHFKELTDRHGKKAMARAGINVRMSFINRRQL
jgi:cyclase